MPEARPWPLEPLLKHERLDQATLAEIVHVDPATITRHMQSGLTLAEADEWCHRLGIHPAQVWASWNDEDPVEQLDLLGST